MGTLESLQSLVNAFQSRFHAEYSKPEYNETELRIDFVNKFFTLLGWDVDNNQHLSNWMREVVHEDHVIVEENQRGVKKFPDYAFQINGEKFFYLETKKPHVNITTSKESAFQVRRYGWNGGLNISVLSNFTDLAIYDCSIPPKEDDDPSVARIALYHYTDYVANFTEIESLLSKQSVIDGTFTSTFNKENKPIKKIPFNAYFLSQMSEWRLELSRDLHDKNPQLSESEVNLLSQRLLNRIVFLRICEDREQERFGILKEITTYQQLKQLFSESDRRYDSGLFDLIDDGNLSLSDSTIVKIFQSLYYPNSVYEFSVVDPYILGHVYELFLTQAVVFNGNQVDIKEKPEVVASNGIVSTPRYLTEKIVKDTLAPMTDGKSVNEICSLHVADICCGSGIFLITLLGYLFSSATNASNINTPLDAFSLKRTILSNCIFGIDVDPLAVEVSKFSLMIKLLEGVSNAVLEEFTSTTGQRILPNIDKHVVCGNSLIDDAYFGKSSTLEDGDFNTIKRINAFNWGGEFPADGFDAIVGNPPYVRVQRLVNSAPEEYQYARMPNSPYSTGKSKTVDKYFLFVERAMSKIRHNGVLGYIIPHKFMTNQTGMLLRRLLANSKRVKKIVHFGVNQVFPGKSTYVCILEIAGHEVNSFELSHVQNLQDFRFGKNTEFEQFSESYLTERPWVFPPADLSSIVLQNLQRTAPLCQLADIHVGLQTSDDKVYLLDHYWEENGYVVFDDPIDGQETCIEAAITRAAIHDQKLTRYYPVSGNSKIIFPYPQNDKQRKNQPYTLEEMERLFPKALDYLSKHRARLDKRSMNHRTKDNWYGYGRGQSISWFKENDRLIWPVLSLTGNYVHDDSVCFTGGGNGPYYGLSMKPDIAESIYYVQALLNHWFLESLVKYSASTFRGGYYSHGKEYVENLPIRRINFSNDNERECHDSIVENVKQLMKLGERAASLNVSTDRQIIHRAMSAIEKKMNTSIDRLYSIDTSKRNEAE